MASSNRTPDEHAIERRASDRGRQPDDEGIVDTLNRPYELFVNPLVELKPDEDKLDEQRRLNDLESRGS